MLRETQVRWRGGGDEGFGAAARFGCTRVRVTLLLLLLQLLSVMPSMSLLQCRAWCRGGRKRRILSPSTMRQEVCHINRITPALSSASAARRPCSLVQTQVYRRRSITVIRFQYHNAGLPPSFVSVQHAQQVDPRARETQHARAQNLLAAAAWPAPPPPQPPLTPPPCLSLKSSHSSCRSVKNNFVTSRLSC